MSEERYEPIAPVNTNVGGDDANKFAVKYKKEIPHIYEILNVLKNLLGDDNPTLVVDEALSEESVHPVQNQAITKAFGNYYTKNDIEKIIESWSGITGGGNAGERHTYRVTIYQQPHQVITVKKIMDGEEATYVSSFMAEEKYERLQVSIEADEGWIPGLLNCDRTLTLNKDYVISASAPIDISSHGTEVVRYYTRGLVDDHTWGPWAGTCAVYTDELCQNRISGDPMGGTYRTSKPDHEIVLYMKDKNSIPPRIFQILFGGTGQYWGHYCYGCTKIVQDLNMDGAIVVGNLTDDCYWLKEIDMSHWNMRTIEEIRCMISNARYLDTIGDISHWNTASLVTVNKIVSVEAITERDKHLNSLDLSGWDTRNLVSATELFPGGWILDISGWDTSKLTSFSISGSIKYLIMDAEEIKFSGNLKCHHPNNSIKYLVPGNMVNAYKNHPNWSAWADQIISIDNYTITRYNGKVDVTPND